jgi:hypothetical protein
MKKQTLVQTFLMAALLVGFIAVASNDVYADGGLIGSGTRSQTMGSGGRTQVLGSGSFSDGGGMIGSGTATNGGGGTIGSGTATPEADSGVIGSGTRSQIIGSGTRAEDSSFFYIMLRYFGF